MGECDGHKPCATLTVQGLIDYLGTCDPDAKVLGFEMNSNAYIGQIPDLPSAAICTVAEDKAAERGFLERAYRDAEDRDARIEREISEIYRYADDRDVIIRL